MLGRRQGAMGSTGPRWRARSLLRAQSRSGQNVQMGDPFMEKLLLEACLEAMATGAVLGIQDMARRGSHCSTCEMGARGDLGLTVELDLVPQREMGMSSYEIMLSGVAGADAAGRR